MPVTGKNQQQQKEWLRGVCRPRIVKQFNDLKGQFAQMVRTLTVNLKGDR